MRWLWPHLRRLWAGIGTIAAGLAVSYIYSLASRQALPDQRSVASFLLDDWGWIGGALIALTATSVIAERAHRQHAARPPKPLRIRPSLLERTGLRRRAVPVSVPTVGGPLMVGRESDLAQLDAWFTQIQSGMWQVVFVSGGPGIGKTTLTRVFLEERDQRLIRAEHPRSPPAAHEVPGGRRLPAEAPGALHHRCRADQ